MRGGIIVLIFFATAWAVVGILVAAAPTWWIGVAIAISIAVLVWANRRPAVGGAQPAHVRRLVGIWSAIEGVVMFVAANVLINLHRTDLIMPVMAIIVGLHFLPLARGIPVRLYYITGTTLMAVGLIALLAPPFHLPLAVGLAAALVLWGSAIALARGVR